MNKKTSKHEGLILCLNEEEARLMRAKYKRACITAPRMRRNLVEAAARGGMPAALAAVKRLASVSSAVRPGDWRLWEYLGTPRLETTHETAPAGSVDVVDVADVLLVEYNLNPPQAAIVLLRAGYTLAEVFETMLMSIAHTDPQRLSSYIPIEYRVTTKEPHPMGSNLVVIMPSEHELSKMGALC